IWLSSSQLALGYKRRTALLPIVIVRGSMIPDLFAGCIFFAFLFRVPGLGKFFVTSIFQRDYPMIMATVLLVAVLWSLTYLASDVLYVLIDPRVRLGARGR